MTDSSYEAWDPEARYAEILERAAADPSVAGVVVFGSRGADAFVTDRSDVDAFVITDGPSADPQRWKTPYASAVEIWPMSLDEFRVHALPGSPDAWNRPTFLHARVDLDRLDGEIARIVERKSHLEPAEAAALARSALDDYVNALYRALRNLEGGRTLEGRLDAIETIGPMLTTAFALERRVRPFNKWLRHELERQPLAGPSLQGLVDVVDRIVADPSTATLRAAFASLEPAARAAGQGAGIDAWEPNVGWLRGGR